MRATQSESFLRCGAPSKAEFQDMSKIRLDKFLVNNRLIDTIQKAQSLIISGNVIVENQKLTKSGTLISENSNVRVLKEDLPYVSRAGEKLESAWHNFDFNINGCIALDLGLSTGGFTDFLLQKEAKYVFGVDVSYGIVDLKIRNNEKLILLERTNARLLKKDHLIKALYKSGLPADIADEISLVVMDLSFISVTKVLPQIKKLVMPGTDFIILIKPQFEADKDQIEAGGVIKSEDQQKAILNDVEKKLAANFNLIKSSKSQVKGKKGNQEYFFWLKAI